MSYDIVRSALARRNCWLLLLETYGINVWCAAGKGTFGTGELVRRIASSRLAEVVSHRRLILPTSYFTTHQFENWTRNESSLLGAGNVLAGPQHAVR